MLEIVDSLEREIEIEIIDKQVPVIAWDGSRTIGSWLSEFIINCLPQN
jgi:hypothetical protein